MSSSGRGLSFGGADAVAPAGLEAVVMAGLTGASSSDRLRTPNVFKSGSFTAAGDTALWTPAGGKKFRLMGFAMYIAGDCAIAVAGEQVILLRDGAVNTGVVRFNPFIPNAAPNLIQGGASIPGISLGNGFLSSTANNVLNVNLSVAFTAGNVDVMAWGTEE